MAEIVELFIVQLRLEPLEVLKMAIRVPTELIDRDDLAMIEGRFASDLPLLSPAFAYKSRLEKMLNLAVSSSLASKMTALREVLVILSSAKQSVSSCPVNRGSCNE